MQMKGKINTSSTPIFSKFPSKVTQASTRTLVFSSFSSSFDQQNSKLSVSTEVQAPKADDDYNVSFKTLGGCKLGISGYPDFEYNAEGGNGEGSSVSVTGNEVSVTFDVSKLYIPSLESGTTKFLGLPLPPFIKIDIVPELFSGKINHDSGQVDIKFRASFLFSVGSIYRAPPLLVETVLTSEESNGEIRSGKGERIDSQGRCRLVGVAIVDPINDFVMNSFLGLPTECLANLNAVISFSSHS